VSFENPQTVADVSRKLELLGLNGALKLGAQLANLRLPFKFVPPRRIVLPPNVSRAAVDAPQQIAERCLKRGVTAGAAEAPGSAKVPERGRAKVAAPLIARRQSRLLMKLLQQLPDLWRRRRLRLDPSLGRALLAEKDLTGHPPDDGRDREDPFAFFAILTEH
jgi:hypothetical protein